MRALRFNAAEILDIAIRIEHNGAAFYRKAAAGRAGGENRGFLLELAAMEEEHEKTFRDMRAALPDAKADPFLPVNDDAGLYLDAMADFHGGEGSRPAAERLDGNEALSDIIRTAIELEVKSILYYEGLLPLVPPHLGRDRVAAIIAEERRHVVVLQRELRRVA